MTSARPSLASGSAAIAAIALALCAGLAPRASAQKDDNAAPSTLSGVYTDAQAARGEETYMGICVACHPPGTYAGDAFKATWNQRPLSDLYDIVSQTMPKQDPGSLSPKEVAQVIAYILKQNRMPAGSSELAAESAPLKKIRIQLTR